MSSSWYVTKYALSDGIREIPREQCQREDKWLWWNQPGSKSQQLFGKSDFWGTRAEAEARAIAMARKRIFTSRMAIARMESLITEWGGGDSL